MTRQIPDSVLFEGEDFSLLESEGVQLFQPERFDLPPRRGRISANWKGYIATYSFDQGQTLLHSVSFIYDEACSEWSAFIQRLPIPMMDSGSILMGAGYVYSMGMIQSPLEFQRVIELQLSCGRLNQVQDWSETIESLRKLHVAGHSGDRSAAKFMKRILDFEYTGPSDRLWFDYEFLRDWPKHEREFRDQERAQKRKVALQNRRRRKLGPQLRRRSRKVLRCLGEFRDGQELQGKCTCCEQETKLRVYESKYVLCLSCWMAW